MDRIETWISEALRRQAGHTLSLQRLHDGLVHDLGAAAGSYHQLQQRLKQARGSFHLQERAHPLADPIQWPSDIREQYENALRRAGIDLSPLVSLPAPPDHQERGILSVLEQTLCALRSACAADQAMTTDLASAFSDLADLQIAWEPAPPTTTVLHGLPPQP